MQSRRSIIVTLVQATALITTPGLCRRAWAQSAQQAESLVRSAAGRLVTIANSTDAPQEKRRRLQEVIVSTVGINEIARFCLGRFWRLATQDQQKQYLSLFGDLLI